MKTPCTVNGTMKLMAIIMSKMQTVTTIVNNKFISVFFLNNCVCYQVSTFRCIKTTNPSQ